MKYDLPFKWVAQDQLRPSRKHTREAVGCEKKEFKSGLANEDSGCVCVGGGGRARSREIDLGSESRQRKGTLQRGELPGGGGTFQVGMAPDRR